jgi:hypothetical protein
MITLGGGLLLALATAGAAVLLLIAQSPGKPSAQLVEAATKLSFALDGRSSQGTCGGVPLTMREIGGEYLTIEVCGPTSEAPKGLIVMAGARGPLTGDPLFDQEVWTGGVDETELLALADPETRKRLVEAVMAGVLHEHGTWKAMLTGRELTARTLVRAARALAAAHPALLQAAGRDVRAAVSSRLRDPSAGVRRRALAVMLERGWTEPATLSALLEDLDPEVRLMAAVASGQWEVLLAMVEKGSRTWRMRAAQGLLERGAPLDERGRAIVEDAALDLLGDDELSEAAAGLLGLVGRPSAMGPLAELGGAAAQAAREAIRARHALQAGGLALAADEGGLSLAGQAGRVSKVTPER